MATFNGTTANDTLIGSSLSDYIAGLGGNDSLSGGKGMDTLDGGSGFDSLDGGKGSDTYIVDSTLDVITDSGGADDRIQASLSIDLNSTAYAGIEHVTLTGTGGLGATGDEFANMLIGNTGANALDGRAGADTMIGGAGDDIYTVDDGNDSVVELSGEGTDQVNSSAALFTLGDFVENLTLTGTTGGAVGVGNALGNRITADSNGSILDGVDGNDTLTGGTGNDLLDGGRGADSMAGGLGSDQYVVDDIGDLITESSAGNPIDNVDSVQSSITYVLGANLENLVLLGTDAIDGTGNSLNNRMFGDDNANTLAGLAGDDFLDGAGGKDLLLGGDGDDELRARRDGDTLVGGAGNDEFTFNSSGGSDLVADFNGLPGGDLLALDLLGGSGITPATAKNFLHAVSDGGSTTLQIDTSGSKNFQDLVVLQGVSTDLDGLLANGSILGIGTLTPTTLVGTTAADTLLAGGTSRLVEGLEGNDSLSGGKGFDTLDGGAGNDTLAGGKGSDTYIVDSVGDAISDSGGKDDRIQASVSIDLNSTAYDGIEHVTLTGSSGLSATGDAVANMLIGNIGANALDGRAGADTMIGGAGNDTYTADDSGDSIVEYAGEGTDQVNSSASFILPEEVENLTLTGTANIDGTGNALGNTITGNAGANGLSGLSGNDTLTGNDGRDTLDGGEGADSMTGGAGEDRYVVDNSGDIVSETGPSTAEADTVVASVTYTLGATLENLILDGTDAIDGTGNSLNNVITGSAGNNVLSGLSGNDLMNGLTGDDLLLGGDGNDLLQVTSSGADTLVGGAGCDIFELDAAVFSAIADFNGLPGGDFIDLQLLLGAVPASMAPIFLQTRVVDGSTILSVDQDGLGGNLPVDIAELRGVSTDIFGLVNNGSILGVFGSFSPPLAGTSGADTLSGLFFSQLLQGLDGNDQLTGSSTGSDTLDGGTGADTLAGGGGNDTYIVDSTSDVVSETGVDTDDRIQASISIDLNAAAYAGIDHVTLTGAATLNATGNAGNNMLIGNDGANVLDGRGGDDQLAGGAGNDSYVVDSLGDRIFETPGDGTDQVTASESHTLEANLENLTLTGTNNSIGEGNDLANTIIGNSGHNLLAGSGGNDTLTDNIGNDTLDGGLGTDSMTGGAGDDTYFVDSATDTIVESSGGGTDTVVSSITYTLGGTLENLTLVDVNAFGSNTVDGAGNSLDNVIAAGGGNNVLSGLAGNDTLDGGFDNDLLLGGDGADRLQASDGADTLAGGAGSDRFVFDARSLDGVDVIADFASAAGGDVLDVSDLLTGFNATSSNINDFLQAVESNGSTTIRVDTDGSGASAGFVDMAVLQGVSTDIAGLLNNGSLVLVN